MSRTPLTTFGIAKALGGKKMSTIYMKIEDVGKMQTTKYTKMKNSMRWLNLYR